MERGSVIVLLTDFGFWMAILNVSKSLPNFTFSRVTFIRPTVSVPPSAGQNWWQVFYMKMSTAHIAHEHPLTHVVYTVVPLYGGHHWNEKSVLIKGVLAFKG